MFIDERIFRTTVLTDIRQLRYQLCEDQRLLRFGRDELQLKLLEDNNPLRVLAPNETAGQDILERVGARDN
jgi:hypothetical protein